MEDYYVEHKVDVFAENDPAFEIDEATFDEANRKARETITFEQKQVAVDYWKKGKTKRYKIETVQNQ
jgi:hypothetical protein